MKNSNFLLAGLLVGVAAALAVRGLWLLDVFPFASLKTSALLPHLLVLPKIAADPVLPNWHLERLLPVILAAHAVAILLAAALAAWTTSRAATQPWASHLALALGGLSFYVAHFCFIHPGAPLAAAGLGVRILDYVAVGSLAFGCFNLLHFFLNFPATHDHAAFQAYLQRRRNEMRARLAISRLPWRRKAAASTNEFEDRRAAFAERERRLLQSGWFPAAIVGVGWFLLLMIPVAGSWRTPAFVAVLPILLACFGVIILGGVCITLIMGLLEWHYLDGAPAVRRAVAPIWRSHQVAAWVFLGLFWSGFGGSLVTKNWAYFQLPVFLLGVLPLLAALLFLITVGIAIRRTPAGPAV